MKNVPVSLDTTTDSSVLQRKKHRDEISTLIHFSFCKASITTWVIVSAHLCV